MNKINVIERFELSWGTTFIVPKGHYKVGDMFYDQENEVYTIEQVIMSTRPTEDEKISLIVRK